MRAEIKRLKEEFEAFRAKAARDYETMQSELNAKARKELEAQKQRYEQMLDELRKNAAGDKEFIVNELKKKIAELEQKIEEMHRSFAKERDEMVSLQKKMQSDFELKMQELQRDHKTVLATMTADHRAEIDRLNESAER